MARSREPGQDLPPDFLEALHGSDGIPSDPESEIFDEADDDLSDEELGDVDVDVLPFLDAAEATYPATNDHNNEHEVPPSVVRDRSPVSPERSRSPHQNSASTLILYDAEGNRYDLNDLPPLVEVFMEVSPESAAQQDMEVDLTEDMPIEEEIFWIPDSHYVFGNVDGMNDEVTNDPLGPSNNRGGSASRVRGRGRGHASMRGRGRGQARRRRGGRGTGLGPAGQHPRGGNNVTFVRGDPLKTVYIHDEDVPEPLRMQLQEIILKRALTAQKAKDTRDSKIDRLREQRRVCERRLSECDDTFFDALDESITGIDCNFVWQSMDTFQCTEETFIPERTGAVHAHTTPYSAFREYWDDEILSRLATETNRYAKSHKPKNWHDTNIHEILVLFAFWMMLGIIRMPTITSCFTVQPLLKVDIFRKLFTLKRYQSLVKYLNFVDTSNQDTTGASSDRLFIIRPVIEHLNRKFKEAYVPDKDICIDESLILWKGKLSMSQYIRTKAAKLGIKTFELCESASGYLWSFIVYTGKQDSLKSEENDVWPKSTSIVIKLIKPLLHKGYRLFMDNWYNSPLLARFLKRNGTDCVGTLAPARAYVPPTVTKLPLKKGEVIARHSGDICVMAWMDQNRVTTISTCHGVLTALPTVSSKDPIRPVPFKPRVVLDYNRSMGGVDLKDQMLEPYLIERKRCAKWYMKFFKRLLNCSILNARILVESSTKKRHDHLAFRLSLVHEILEQHLPFIPKPPAQCRTVDAGPSRLTPIPHWPVRHDIVQSFAQTNRHTVKRCVVCYREGRKGTKSQYKCETCDIPLCIDPCFKSYHQQNH